ncbi:MAG: hypothetical protein J1E56_07400 [Ruminococcus sp.]|nr:hypothetical protein [Ruminococcus sp.]
MDKSKKSSVLACVTGQYDCDRIIKTASEIAESKNMPLHVLCVLKTTENYGSLSNELEYLYQTAKTVNADMTVLFSDNAPKAAADFAGQIRCRRMVSGMHNGEMTGFLVLFNELRSEIPITMIDKDKAIYSMEPINEKV